MKNCAYFGIIFATATVVPAVVSSGGGVTLMHISLSEGTQVAGGGAYRMEASIVFGPSGSAEGGPFFMELLNPFDDAEDPNDPLPDLRIQLDGVTVRISWEPTPAGFVLESTPDLGAVNWQPVANGEISPAQVPLGSANAYFRLRKQ